MIAFWPEAKEIIHIDSWREVTSVDGNSIEIIAKNELQSSTEKLFFMNSGGYMPNEFEEYHYKLLTVAATLSIAKKDLKKQLSINIMVLKELLLILTTLIMRIK